MLMAYLKLLLNPEDDAALLTVLNEPPRGLGAWAQHGSSGAAMALRLRGADGFSSWLPC